MKNTHLYIKRMMLVVSMVASGALMTGCDFLQDTVACDLLQADSRQCT